MFILGLTDDVGGADREEVVDKEELVDHHPLTALFRVQELLSLVFANALIAEVLDILD